MHLAPNLTGVQRTSCSVAALPIFARGTSLVFHASELKMSAKWHSTWRGRAPRKQTCKQTEQLAGQHSCRWPPLSLTAGRHATTCVCMPETNSPLLPLRGLTPSPPDRQSRWHLPGILPDRKQSQPARGEHSPSVQFTDPRVHSTLQRPSGQASAHSAVHKGLIMGASLSCHVLLYF